MPKSSPILDPLPKRAPGQLWRHYCDIVNIAWLTPWLPTELLEVVLKTDLYDESITDGLRPFLRRHFKRVVAIDLSYSVAYRARSRCSDLEAVAADVRRSPFPECTFEAVVSNSTLDHFRSKEEIGVSLHELHRVLRPGGTLLLTLDNRLNPLIALRNALPFRLLNRLGIVPHYVGVTLAPGALRETLERVGFETIEIRAIMHCPRVLAVAIAQWMQKHTASKTNARFVTFLKAFEGLSGLPTRFLTGNFVAATTIKR